MVRDSDACSLWQGDDELVNADGFWETFRRLLAYVAGARNERGDPNFEANKLTDLYVEVIQAACGSRWVPVCQSLVQQDASGLQDRLLLIQAYSQCFDLTQAT